MSAFGHTFLTPSFEKPPFRLHIKRDNSLALLIQNFTDKIDFFFWEKFISLNIMYWNRSKTNGITEIKYFLNSFLLQYPLSSNLDEAKRISNNTKLQLFSWFFKKKLYRTISDLNCTIFYINNETTEVTTKRFQKFTTKSFFLYIPDKSIFKLFLLSKSIVIYKIKSFYIITWFSNENFPLNNIFDENSSLIKKMYGISSW